MESRRLHDPAVLKALAHPARLRMLEVLQERGGATATACSSVVGLTPSACSWHLRLLARAGLVEDAGVARDGRERAWRSTVPSWRVERDEIDADPAQASALDQALTRALLQASDAAVETWAASVAGGGESPQWQHAALVSNSTLRVTAGELAELTRRVQELLAPYTLQERAAPPPDARAVHVALRLLPVSPPGPPAAGSAG